MNRNTKMILMTMGCITAPIFLVIGIIFLSRCLSAYGSSESETGAKSGVRIKPAAGTGKSGSTTAKPTKPAAESKSTKPAKPPAAGSKPTTKPAESKPSKPTTTKPTTTTPAAPLRELVKADTMLKDPALIANIHRLLAQKEPFNFVQLKGPPKHSDPETMEEIGKLIDEFREEHLTVDLDDHRETLMRAFWIHLAYLHTFRARRFTAAAFYNPEGYKPISAKLCNVFDIYIDDLSIKELPVAELMVLFPNLRSIFINKSQVEIWITIGELVGLQSLSITSCNFPPVLPDISRLIWLTKLSLQSCTEVEKISFTGYTKNALKSFAILNLAGCKKVGAIEGLSHAANNFNLLILDSVYKENSVVKKWVSGCKQETLRILYRDPDLPVKPK